MHLRAFASSSRGNCSLLYNQDTALLVDAGISCRKIKQRLQTAGLTPDDLSGILITHEHTDHIAGLSVLLKNYNIPLYATPGTALVLARICDRRWMCYPGTSVPCAMKCKGGS